LVALWFARRLLLELLELELLELLELELLELLLLLLELLLDLRLAVDFVLPTTPP
jgi:hypothetical protein